LFFGLAVFTHGLFNTFFVESFFLDKMCDAQGGVSVQRWSSKGGAIRQLVILGWISGGFCARV
jgi:hypothetical protein